MILKYLRKCLADEELLSLEEMKLLGGESIDLNDILQGQLSPSLHEQFVSGLVPKNQSKPVQVIICPVVLIEKDTYGKSEKYARKVFTPIYVPAWLTSKGRLLVPEEEEPWISRHHLRPNPSNNFPLWGNLEEYETFIRYEGTLKNCDTWRRYIDKCNRMLEESCFFTYTHVPPGFEVLGSKIVAVLDPIQKEFKEIFKLYDQVTSQNKVNALMDRTLEGKVQDVIGLTVLEKGENFAAFAAKRIDSVLQPSEKILLSQLSASDEGDLLLGVTAEDSDNTAILQTLILDSWVNAAILKEWPPIIFVVAGEKGVLPSVLQLFRNEDFKAMGLLGRHWLTDVRSYATLSLSVPQFLKEKERYSGLHLYIDDDKMFPSLESETYLEKAEPRFLQVAGEYFGESLPLEAIIDRLHAELVAEVNELELCAKKAREYIKVKDSIPSSAADLLKNKDDIFQKANVKIDQALVNQAKFNLYIEEESQRLSLVSKIASKMNASTRAEVSEGRKKFFEDRKLSLPENLDIMDVKAIQSYLADMVEKVAGSLKKAQPQFEVLEKNVELQEEWFSLVEEYGIDTEMEEIECSLNRRFRLKIFLLASHYWEAEYLRSLPQKLRDLKDGKLLGGKKVRVDWQMRAMLTPCLLTTFNMLPKLFHLDINNYSTIVQGVIDILVVDQGDSVSPYTVMPSFIFANKCLVLGSGKKAVRAVGLSPSIEKGNLVFCGFEDDAIAEEMECNGLLGAGQSLTKLAQTRTIYSNRQGERGIFLEGEVGQESNLPLDEKIAVD